MATLGFSLVAESLEDHTEVTADELWSIGQMLVLAADAAQRSGERMIAGTFDLAREYLEEIQDFKRQMEKEEAA